MQLISSTTHCQIHLPPKWVNASAFDLALGVSGGPHAPGVATVSFTFPNNCKLMVDAAVRLLSLVNQLSFTTRQVRLEFLEGETGTMGYLSRMGFFDHLSDQVSVLPARPLVSRAQIYGGTNSELVEIARINPKSRDQELPARLSKAVAASLHKRQDASSIEGAIWTVFAELIDNVFSHSSTLLDGYAALQLYKRGKGLQVTVSDSGTGIMQTLRPALQHQSPSLAALSDTDLLVEMFRQGISRHGPDRGLGLKGSAEKAMKFKAELEVRLPQHRTTLVPSNGAYEPSVAYCYSNLALIWGTHISFRFNLDI